jgi:hypothetical protein
MIVAHWLVRFMVSLVRLGSARLNFIVLITTCKLRHYFEVHKFMVVTGFLIGNILYNQETVGRIAKWACELGIMTLSSHLIQRSIHGP